MIAVRQDHRAMADPGRQSLRRAGRPTGHAENSTRSIELSLHPRDGSRRTARQQDVERRATACGPRQKRVAISSLRAAGTAGRPAGEPVRRDRHYRRPLPLAAAEPQGRAGASRQAARARLAPPQAAHPDATDRGIEGTAPCQQETAGQEETASASAADCGLIGVFDRRQPARRGSRRRVNGMHGVSAAVPRSTDALSG